MILFYTWTDGAIRSVYTCEGVWPQIQPGAKVALPLPAEATMVVWEVVDVLSVPHQRRVYVEVREFWTKHRSAEFLGQLSNLAFGR